MICRETLTTFDNIERLFKELAIMATELGVTTKGKKRFKLLENKLWTIRKTIKFPQVRLKSELVNLNMLKDDFDGKISQTLDKIEKSPVTFPICLFHERSLISSIQINKDVERNIFKNSV